MNVYQAILEVQRKVTHVEKGDQYNGGQTRFAYRGIDRVVTALAPAMREVGLLMMPTDTALTEYLNVMTAGGKQASLARVLVTYTLAAADDPHTVTVIVPGEAMDSGDKSVSKAMSVAWRTALIQVFNLPTGEPDPDSEVFDVAQPATTRAEAAMVRTAERDAILADWEAAIEATDKTREAFIRLYNQAVQAKAPKEIVDKILSTGNGLS
jgi:hypothetical protein